MQLLKVRSIVWLATIVAVVAAGCGGPVRIKVGGRVTRVDGTPVSGAKVLFRSSETGASADGITDDDGNYEVGGVERGDGVPPGKYQVAVSEKRGGWDNPKARTIHPVYESPSTSGLECEVTTSSSSMNYDMELELPNTSGKS